LRKEKGGKGEKNIIYEGKKISPLSSPHRTRFERRAIFVQGGEEGFIPLMSRKGSLTGPAKKRERERGS